MITVFADQYLYNIASYLPDSVDLVLYDPAEGLPKGLDHAQALLVRTVNPITPQTLPDIPAGLSFIGTGSSGTDHVDQAYLKASGITFADAAGCNARSVAEYLATSLLIWEARAQYKLQDLCAGIIGVGHVGRQVDRLLQKMDIATCCYDPPRAQRDPGFSSSTLEEVLAADILTFHTPLTRSGPHPTHHWLDAAKLSTHQYELVINSARGGILDEGALCKAQDEGTVRHFILDVWENEPDINLDVAARAFLKTPHIAGYSVQAKQNASRFIADALIQHFRLPPQNESQDTAPLQISEPADLFKSLPAVMDHLHPIREYESELKQILQKQNPRRSVLFNRLRAEFPLRQEFSHIQLPATYFERFPVLKKMGFHLL
ncbi:4-phosphoerythronate dehydrogenase [Fodinibius sediminis]|uniref:4-phosphoerythronate dehydrogenase n=1 Tax=Fodinibius sediminis TaxID=1214077 RepID=A0A521E018_9BACT|nr:4-phosphoerythronate dehydrogenase [Fodinibius sediminis]SMO77307.1 4-phosphoerythronate dehydrogenase [Fodinibius sediminis]